MNYSIQSFPEHMDQLEVDRKNMRLCQVSGLFEEETAPINGRRRHFLTYLAPDLESDRNVLIVAPPSQCDPVEFLESSGLKRLADEHKFFLHLLIAEDGKWDLGGDSADYFHGVFDASTSRKHYVTMIKQDNFYALGFGDGADVALQAVTRAPQNRQTADGRQLPPLSPHSDLFSSLGLIGDLSEEGMRFAQEEQCPVPVWMWSRDSSLAANQNVLSYWKKVNRCQEIPFSGDGADLLYRPSPVRTRSEVNEESIAQVRLSKLESSDSVTEEQLEQLIQFLFQTRRHVSFGGKKNLRYFKDAAAMGAQLRTIEVDGWNRRWYEYIPEKVLREGTPAPLVLTLHARGMDAAGFFDISGMSCVAEERGFICCFPESSIYQQKPGGLATLPLWSSFYQDTPFDDIKFIRMMVDDVASRLPVDRSRIYACGQSSGGMMCSELAWYASDLFAAVACWSGLWMEKEQHILRECSDAPIPMLFLYGAQDWLVAGKQPDPEYAFSVGEEMRPRITEFMQKHHLQEPAEQYTCHPIDYYVYHDKSHVPMLTVGVVQNMTHCNYPEQSWISWDQFFCKFRRLPDGSLSYMGRQIPLEK